MTFLRRSLAFLFFCVMNAANGIAAPIVLTDVAGREVTLAAPAQQLVLAQARNFPVLALLDPDPARLLAGWSDEFKNSFANDYAQYLKKFPALADVPIVGRHTVDTFSVEKALALRPDLVILTLSFAGLDKASNEQSSPLIRRFEDAGVPVVVIDFFVSPMENTVPSMMALGKALGREQQAESFVAFYQDHMRRISDRLKQFPERAKKLVFVHAHAGSTDCCNSPGVGTFNDMISYAGGHNIGSDVLKSATGRLSFEYVNVRNPVVYVATGTGSGKRTGTGLTIGADVQAAEARSSLQRIIEGNRLGALPAVRNGNAHGIWHAFNDSPLHVVFIEALARWIDPELFSDISPEQTLQEINTRYLPVPMEGTYMVDLQAP